MSDATTPALNGPAALLGAAVALLGPEPRGLTGPEVSLLKGVSPERPAKRALRELRLAE